MSTCWTLKIENAILTHVAQSVGHHPAKLKVSSLVPGWGMYEGQPTKSLSYQCFSPSSSPSLPLSLKINNFLKNLFKNWEDITYTFLTLYKKKINRFWISFCGTSLTFYTGNSMYTYVFCFRFCLLKEGRKRRRETSMSGCFLLTPPLRTWPATQACALTGN